MNEQRSLLIEEIVDSFLDQISVYKEDIQEEIVSFLYLMVKSQRQKNIKRKECV